MPQVTGRVFIALDGTRIRSKEGAKLTIGGISREAQKSDAGVDGYAESIEAPTVDCKISHTADISLSGLHAFKGNVVFETDTGRTFTLTEAWSAKPPELEKSEVTLSFAGRECVEG